MKPLWMAWAAGKARALKAYAAQVCVCLDDVFHGFGAHAVFNGDPGIAAVPEQGFIAKLGELHGGKA